jgi:hypothetical protein
LCGKVKEREKGIREGGEIFNRVSKNKFNGYRPSILLTYDLVTYSADRISSGKRDRYRCIATSFADPVLFYPLGSGIRDEFFPSDPRGIFFGEIFLRILVL